MNLSEQIRNWGELFSEAVEELESENEELETNLSLAISMYEGEDSPMAKLEQEKAKLEAENRVLRDGIEQAYNSLNWDLMNKAQAVLGALLTGEHDER